jgi:hypothetical protein
MTLSKATRSTLCRYSECRIFYCYTEYHYAECRGVIMGELLALPTNIGQARKKFARDQHSCLFVRGIGDEAKYENIDTRAQCYKTFYIHNLLMFIISHSFCSWQAFPARSNVCG